MIEAKKLYSSKLSHHMSIDIVNGMLSTLSKNSDGPFRVLFSYILFYDSTDQSKYKYSGRSPLLLSIGFHFNIKMSDSKSTI